MNKTKNYISPEGYQRLLAERDQLVKVERPEITKVVAWAASLGDRSENADYQYGKKRMREIDRRIAFLNKRIAAALVVDPQQIKSDKVQFGATVTVSDEAGSEKIFTIVGEDESSPKNGLISWRSPIGHSLLGKSVGDVITVRAPNGEHEMEIISIEYSVINLPKEQDENQY